MKSIRTRYTQIPRRPWMATAGLLVAAFLIAACGGSATGATPDITNTGQATAAPTLESTTAAQGATPIVVPTPDQGGLSREQLLALLASPTPESQVVSPPSTPEQGAVAAGDQATPDPGSGSNNPPPAASPIPAPTPVPTPDGPVGGEVGDQAAELEGIVAWINSDPLTVQGLRGKVVLVDFWTYTCINCIRTFPFLKLWHARYADDGLVILGVHTPEFDFEKVLDNVVAATRDNSIAWPVALDNGYATWNNYSNRFWPAKYLIDGEGVVRYTHFGEGAYAETERQIRDLLEENGADLSDDDFTLPSDQQIDPTYRNSTNAEITRELYAGYDRGYFDFQYGQGGYVKQPEYYQVRNIGVSFQSPAELLPNLIYFDGLWEIGPESATHAQEGNSSEDFLSIVYSARSVNAVLTSESGEDYRVMITMNGEDLTDDNKGADVTIGADGESYILVTGSRLYNIVENPVYQRRQTLRMSSDSAEFGLFAFTFGVYEKAG